MYVHELLVLHRARSKSTIGFSPDSFSSMARLELTSSLNGLPHQLSPSAIEAPLLSFSTLRLDTQHDATLVSAVRRCALTHAVFETLGSGEDAASQAAARLKASSWTSWSLRAMVLGASARPTKVERTKLIGSMEATLSAALEPAIRSEVTGAADPWHSCRLVALFGASGGTQLLRHLASGAAVPVDGYDYIATGTPHVHGNSGLLGVYSAATSAPLDENDDDDKHSAIPATRCPPMCAELAVLMANLALNGRSMASVLDPCAGGGSLLIAAALVGATRVHASDADPRATRRTAAAFGAAFGDGGDGSGEDVPLLVKRSCDVAQLLLEAEEAVAGRGTAKVDAILCDPPYGIKAASLGARDLVLARVLALAAWRLRPGGRLVLLAPSSSAGPQERPEEEWCEAAEVPAALALLGDWEQTFRKGGLARRLRVYERVPNVAPPPPTAGLSSQRTRWEGGGLPDRRRVRPRRGASQRL